MKPQLFNDGLILKGKFMKVKSVSSRILLMAVSFVSLNLKADMDSAIQEYASTCLTRSYGIFEWSRGDARCSCEENKSVTIDPYKVVCNTKAQSESVAVRDPDQRLSSDGGSTDSMEASIEEYKKTCEEARDGIFVWNRGDAACFCDSENTVSINIDKELCSNGKAESLN
jgi:hypothetical protein